MPVHLGSWLQRGIAMPVNPAPLSLTIIIGLACKPSRSRAARALDSELSPTTTKHHG
jgi:hypothetical protein